MPFLRKMQIFDSILQTVQAIDISNVGELYNRRVFSPVFFIRDDQLRARRRQGGNLGVVGFVIPAFMNGHAAFAGTAAEKVGGYLNDRDRDGDPLIDGCQQKSLGASSGSPSHRD